MLPLDFFFVDPTHTKKIKFREIPVEVLLNNWHKRRKPKV